VRAAGAFPSYPLPRRAADERRRFLAGRLAEIEAELMRPRRRPLSAADRDRLFGERQGWLEEHDALADALDLVDSILPTLDRCGCGKLVHLAEASAQRHARALGYVDDRLVGGRISVYVCRVRRERAWHVGHNKLEVAAATAA